MDTEQVVDNFFGVYLLYCKNPIYKGRTYIGYTIDPARRIKQHNAGKEFGGAWKTSNRGPWEMVLIVHGFPNSISALQFEWAWQHPEHSRRLKHLLQKKTRRRTFENCLSVLSTMLNVPPWVRLPLTVRWLDDEFGKEYTSHVSPPLHMPITYGKVTSKRLQVAKKKAEILKNKEASSETQYCSICSLLVGEEDKITCVEANCTLNSHLICLAKLFEQDKFLPLEGCCPVCNVNVLWGDLIRKKIGCAIHFDEEDDDSYSSDD